MRKIFFRKECEIMDELRKKIAQELRKLEEMINVQEDKENIELQRKKLDELLKKYIKDI